MVPLRWVHVFPFIIFCSVQFSLVQFSSVAPTLWDPMDCSTSGLPVPHQLLELTQTRVHWVSDAIRPSHPLSPSSPPALNLSQHQGLFKRFSSSHQVAKVLEFQLQYQSFQWIFRTYFLISYAGLISLQSKGLSRVFSSTTVQKHLFFSTKVSFYFFSFIFISWRLITLKYCSGTQVSLWSNSHIHTWLVEKP